MREKQLELTIKASIIGIILALILCGANIYLSLKIGNTISASIPASILAMGVLRMFKNYSVLENNISQTIASAGEAIAAIVIFVFPAMLILGTWSEFNYWSICLMSICGGFVGIVFSVILRKVLLNDKNLTFPEGQAIGQVLLTAADKDNKSGLGALLSGMAISGTLNFCQTGIQVLASGYYKFFKIGKGVIGLGTSFSTAIIGAGFLVGFNSATVALIALIGGWCVLLPIFSAIHGLDEHKNLMGNAFFFWKNYIRPIGIGVMIFSGIATIISLARPIKNGIRESVEALKNLSAIDPKERDISIKILGVVLVLACIPITVFIYYQMAELTSYSVAINIGLTILLMALVLVLGFIIASVAGYFAGFVGSTNSPNSGLLFIGVISLSLVLLTITHGHIDNKLATLFTTIVLLVGFIGFAACITNDNAQDFKSGQIVGGSPYKQQISLFFGVIASSFVAPLLIQLVFYAYGIAGIVPHPGIDPNSTLSAPQASAIAMLTKNIISSSQDWSLIFYGIGIGVIALILDTVLRKKYKIRCPILSVGLGIYLPPDLIFALFLGGFLRLLVSLKHKKITKTESQDKAKKLTHKTNLFVCGLVTGESLMGLFLAVPFVLKESSDALKIVGDNYTSIGQILGAITTILVIWYTYKVASKE